MSETICFRNIGQLIQVEPGERTRLRQRDRCALVVHGGCVEKVVRNSAINPSDYAKVVDMQGRAVIPGLVDCHTHLVYAGERKNEMEQRLSGLSYQDIHKNGGGILNTVKATRQASEKTLFDQALTRMRRMMVLGTTAFEIKSGYGLDLKTEKKILLVARRLKERLRTPVTLTYLGAHAVPKGQSKSDYFNFIMENLPEFRNLADGVDIFCEEDAFSVTDLKRLFLHARLLGFRQLRAHVEEFSHQGGCFHAAKLGATSCDHLEYATPHDIRGMGLSGTVAVLMPGVTTFLGGERIPLVHNMIDAGVTLALATDCNPGSSPNYNMQTVLHLAMSLYRLTPEQALIAATYGSAKALNGEKSYGGLLPGQRADFLQLKTGDYRDLFYYFGENLVEKTFSGGVPVKGGKALAVL